MDVVCSPTNSPSLTDESANQLDRHARGPICDSMSPDVPKRGMSIEQIVTQCRRSCPLSRLEAQLRQQIAALEGQQQHLQAETSKERLIRESLESELAALRDPRSWLQRWYRHRDGCFKKRWVLSFILAGHVGAYYWFYGEKATTPVGRCVSKAMEKAIAWRDHASAVTDDMTVMGPFIHQAAEVVRLMYSTISDDVVGVGTFMRNLTNGARTMYTEWFCLHFVARQAEPLGSLIG